MDNLSKEAIEKLKKSVNYDGDCDVEYNRPPGSKWILEVRLVKGMCVIAGFKFDCKKGTMERTV